MPDCLAVDPSELIARADRLRTLGAEVRPTAREAEALRDELTAIGSTTYGRAGEQFSSSWALAMFVVAGTLETIGEHLDEAAAAYATFEELLAEAFS